MVDDNALKTQINKAAPSLRNNQALRIELFYLGKLIVVEKSDFPFYLGRDEESCDMIIQGDTISRRHCLFQVRDNQIGLMDTSTNGTYIKPGISSSVFIHNEYYPLVGQGCIKLGQAIEDDTEVLHYKIATT